MPNPDLERVRERIADIAALRHKAATEPSFNSTVQEFLSHHVPLLIDDAERLVTAHAAAEGERDTSDRAAKILSDEAHALRQERDSLRAAVKEHGRHKPDCESIHGPRMEKHLSGDHIECDCDCGLAKHLAAHERGEEG